MVRNVQRPATRTANWCDRSTTFANQHPLAMHMVSNCKRPPRLDRIWLTFCTQLEYIGKTSEDERTGEHCSQEKKYGTLTSDADPYPISDRCLLPSARQEQLWTCGSPRHSRKSLKHPLRPILRSSLNIYFPKPSDRCRGLLTSVPAC